MHNQVLFIGLGNMGLPMALNLVRAGLGVSGHDLAARNVATFVEGGGQAMDTSRRPRRCEVVVTMLHEPDVGNFLGAEGT